MSNECVKLEIPQFPELTFEEERHLYYLNGLEVPSVTTLMKPLSSDFYSTVDPEVLNKAAKRGTAIHNAVENYAKFGMISALNAVQTLRWKRSTTLWTAGTEPNSPSSSPRT